MVVSRAPTGNGRCSPSKRCGALMAALAGAPLSGYLRPLPGVPGDNPPGYMAAFWAVPGSLIAMALSYRLGSHKPQERIGL
jgi:hypothetical protein